MLLGIRRWISSCREGAVPTKARVQVGIVAVVLLGLVAESVSYGWRDLDSWVPDVVVGWTFASGGFVIAIRKPDSRMGPLLVAVGCTWFIGNFQQVGLAPIALAAGQFLLMYRAVLLYVLLTFPTGRVRSPAHLIAIVAGCVVWAIPAAEGVPAVVIGVTLVAIGLTVVDRVRAAPPARRLPTFALTGAALIGATFIGGSLVHAFTPAGDLDGAVLLADEVALILVAIGLSVALLVRPGDPGLVTNLVVELSESQSGTLGSALARALGDPTLELGYWHPPSAAYLDPIGTPIAIPPIDPDRVVTPIAFDGLPGAVIVHDPAVLEGDLPPSIATAARLAAANARLDQAVLDQLPEVRASRRRILLAEDDARRRLGDRIDRGALGRTAALSTGLSSALETARQIGDESIVARLERASSLLGEATEDLRALVRGLDPGTLTQEGLPAALERMALDCPVPVDLDVTSDRLDRAIEVAVYFVCAEALSNVAKHARASRASVVVAQHEGDVDVEITDDGVGGARADQNSGLRGLADRVGALGGMLEVASGGTGTRIAARIPTNAGRASEGAGQAGR